MKSEDLEESSLFREGERKCAITSWLCGSFEWKGRGCGNARRYVFDSFHAVRLTMGGSAELIRQLNGVLFAVETHLKFNESILAGSIELRSQHGG
jgi:hypothetical protein